jgi:ketol-acid reductoisomerase
MEPVLDQQMRESLEEIRSGAFAKEWSTDRKAKLEFLEKVREIQKDLPFTKWEEQARRAFGLGNANGSSRD